MKGARWFVVCVVLALAVVSREARAAVEVEAFARVVVEETALRSGPGVSHRVVYVAHRGETFVIESRKGAGFWLKVALPDGRTGWVLGETVQPIAVNPNAPDRPSTPGFFAPPPLAEARGGVAILGGALDETSSRGSRNGYLEVRPAFVLAPTIAFEPFAGMALTENGNELLYGGAFTVHLAPDWAIEPYGTLGLGGMIDVPQRRSVRPAQGNRVGGARRRRAPSRAAAAHPRPPRGQQLDVLHGRLVSQCPALRRRPRCVLLGPHFTFE